MRILNVVSSLDPSLGGVAEALRQYALAARALGAEDFDVVTLERPGAPWLAQFPAQVHALGPRYTHYSYAPRLAPWLAQNAPRYDALISHGVWEYHGLPVRRAARRHGRPYFVFVHGMLDPWFRRSPLKHAKKWLFWPWSGYPVLRDAAAVLFTAEEEMRRAPESFWLYRARPRVAPLGIEAPPAGDAAQRAEFARAFPELAAKRFILYLGRIHEKKGIDVLIQAFGGVARERPQVRLAIAGPDRSGLRPRLERLAARLGIGERVCWLGELRAELKWGALRAADAFVLSSHTENFGFAVVEAMACGTPVLISERVQIWREIAADGAALTGPDDAEGFAGVLSRWFAMQESERQQMRERAIDSFQRRFQRESAYRALTASLGAAA
ncbi:MAG TPA: glycosyltransferase [Burkholderiales bacterium]|nr:glycosyltransferase [Burkholderiales bacterium]